MASDSVPWRTHRIHAEVGQRLSRARVLTGRWNPYEGHQGSRTPNQSCFQNRTHPKPSPTQPAFLPSVHRVGAGPKSDCCPYMYAQAPHPLYLKEVSPNESCAQLISSQPVFLREPKRTQQTKCSDPASPQPQGLRGQHWQHVRASGGSAASVCLYNKHTHRMCTPTAVASPGNSLMPEARHLPIVLLTGTLPHHASAVR